MKTTNEGWQNNFEEHPEKEGLYELLLLDEEGEWKCYSTWAAGEWNFNEENFKRANWSQVTCWRPLPINQPPASEAREIKSIHTRIVPVGRAKCPYCKSLVAIEPLPNSEFTTRCYIPCAKLFAVKTDGYRVVTAKIDWDSGIVMWREDTPLAAVDTTLE